MSNDIEGLMSSSIQSAYTEKTYLDKIFSKEDVNEIRELIRKDTLSRQDLLDLLYLLSSTESKLLNYGAYDRYIMAKFFVWIRDFVKIAEVLLDYTDDLKDKNVILSSRGQKTLDNCTRLIQHNIKFLVDLYFNLGRTTLSLGGTGFLEALKNKFDYAYSGIPTNTPAPQESGGFGNIIKGIGKK